MIMHNKKLLLIMSLIMLATVCIGVVSAVDDTLELDGVKFHIPSGYDEITSYATDDEVEEYSSFDVTSSHRTYMDGNDYLGITVSEYSDHPNLESLNKMIILMMCIGIKIIEYIHKINDYGNNKCISISRTLEEDTLDIDLLKRFLFLHLS